LIASPGYITANVPELKASKSFLGTAGRKNLLIMEELKCDETEIDSEVKYLQGISPAALLAAPREAGVQPRRRLPVMPSTSDDDSGKPEVAASS
jgi:hypothetical protein